MFNPFSFSGPAPQKSYLLLAPALLAGLCVSSSAQTAPQLLPYTAKLIAGGGTAAIAAGATCPVSGFTSTDAYGDGCLATEINIAPTSTSGTGPRYAIADSTGAVFFSDATNGLVRRIDPITGIVTAVAGGKSSSPGAGVACGTGVSTDSDGDGCPANLVKLSHPMGLAFDAQGNLYFADNGYDDVRKIAATAGFITTTGIITNVAGGSTYGYNVNNTSASGPVNAATQSYLNFPYDVAFDKAGNLYIADEGNNAIEVINMQATTQTIQGISIPAGTIAKISGYGSLAAKSATSGDCPDFVSTSARGGCYFGKWTDGTFAASDNNDGVYSVALDSNNNLFFSNEFNNNVGMITPANVISTYAGIQGTAAKKIQRGVAGSFAIGSVFGVTIDANNNLYTTDASSGLVWRVDAGTKNMYVVGGGATTVCSAATDTYGDGCPATQATFGSSGTGNFATTTLPGPGIFGVKVDPYSDLFLGDTETGVIREIASGTQFGTVGANQPTNIVDIHFAVSDGPSGTAPYTLSSGSSNFSLGTAACTTNSDSTTDCLLPVTATPSVLGQFTGTLTVTSQLGATANFSLSGTYAQSPITRTVINYAAPAGSCTGTSIYSTTTPITLTATLVANGPAPPTGTITFFANGTQLGTAQNVVNLGTTSNPVYGATLANTFSTPNAYTITATYSGNSYFKTSTSGSAKVTSSNPTFTASSIVNQQNTVAPGQTGLYSFNLAQNVYTGTITLACSGLPANSSCSFSPTTIAATGCSTTNVVAMSILTQQGAVKSSGAAGLATGGRDWWSVLGMVSGFGLALLIGIRRRKSSLRFGQLWMVLALLVGASGMLACGGQLEGGPATPAGSYTVTVTATGSTGTTSTFTVPLTVTK